MGETLDESQVQRKRPGRSVRNKEISHTTDFSPLLSRPLVCRGASSSIREWTNDVGRVTKHWEGFSGFGEALGQILWELGLKDKGSPGPLRHTWWVAQDKGIS